jgi:hypothetical protein
VSYKHLLGIESQLCQEVNELFTAQVATDQESFLIIANALSNHPNDKREALPTLDAIPGEIGTPNGVSVAVREF